MCAYVYMLFQRNVKVGSDKFFLPCRPNAEKDHFLSVKNNLILSYFDLKELRWKLTSVFYNIYTTNIWTSQLVYLLHFSFAHSPETFNWFLLLCRPSSFPPSYEESQASREDHPDASPEVVVVVVDGLDVAVTLAPPLYSRDSCEVPDCTWSWESPPPYSQVESGGCPAEGEVEEGWSVGEGRGWLKSGRRLTEPTWKRYCRLDFVQTLPLDSDVRVSMFAIAWSRGCPSWKAAFCCTVAEN